MISLASSLLSVIRNKHLLYSVVNLYMYMFFFSRSYYLNLFLYFSLTYNKLCFFIFPMDKKNSHFEDKKGNILLNIQAGLEELDHNLKILNQNLQVMGSIGNTQFTETSALWSTFQHSLADSAANIANRLLTTTRDVTSTHSTTFRGTTSFVLPSCRRGENYMH